MAKKGYTKFDSKFEYAELETKLSGLTANSAYSFTRRGNATEFNNLLSLLPTGYAVKLKDNIESIDLIYSGSTDSPFLLTLAVGRNDSFQGKEAYDIDVLNIAPDTATTSSYFSQLWHHFKGENDNRVSYEIMPHKLSDEQAKKDATYGVFLTGSTYYNSFDDYQKEKPDFYKLHTKSFGELGM